MNLTKSHGMLRIAKTFIIYDLVGDINGAYDTNTNTSTYIMMITT